jgi:hypothetical protein
LEIVMTRYWLSRILITIVAAVAMCGHTQTHAQTVNVVEYRNKTLDAYFITGRANEQALLDTLADFSRTGMTFQAVSAATSNAALTKICRFYVSLASPFVNSHFYGRQGTDCETVLAANPPGFTYEGYDFALQSPTAGACPADTFAVSRSFRALNGGKTSNHRYTVSAATYASAASSGYVGEGVAFCATAVTDASGPTATAVGVVTGTTTSSNTIGPAGGNVTSTDGKMFLVIPAGALAANTVISIQAISNNAHGKIGGAYRLTPDGQTFTKPVTLTFAYSDADLEGTAPAFLGGAFQTPTGFWKWLGVAAVNTANKNVSVNTSHFTDFSAVRGLQIRPPKKTVKPSATVALEVRACYERIDEELADLSTGLGYDCDNDQGPTNALTVDQWSVNGRLGGGGVFGTVVGSGGWSGVYTAPANAPTPPTVAVSARVRVTGLSGSDLVVSNITIAEDSWTGTGKSTSEATDATAEVIWTRESIVGNVATYRPSGVVSVTVHGCARYDPSTGVIDPASGGVLFVDFNTNPPTYHGSGLALWPSILTFTCPNSPPPISTFLPAAFFGGSKGTLGIEAAGEVSGGGTTISGTDTNTQGAPVTFTWNFTRN